MAEQYKLQIIYFIRKMWYKNLWWFRVKY